MSTPAQVLAASQSVAFAPLVDAPPLLVWLLVLGFVFAECGLIIGLFLPGDSMLLTAGVVLSGRGAHLEVWLLALAVIVVAVAGNELGYAIGKRSGTKLLVRKGSSTLSMRNLQRAQRFFSNYGFWAIAAARWLPWVRTLAPIVAGAAKMPQRRFTIASTIGAMAWAPTLLLVGYYGGHLLQQVPWLHSAVLVLGLIFIGLVTLAGLYRYLTETQNSVAVWIQSAIGGLARLFRRSPGDGQSARHVDAHRREQ